MPLPKVTVTDVLTDVDDTITYPKDGRCRGAGFLDLLADLVCEKMDVSKEKAFSVISETADPETRCCFSFCDDLGVSPEIYWQRVQEWLGACLGVKLIRRGRGK